MFLLPPARGPLLRRLLEVHVLDLPPGRATQNEVPNDATTGDQEAMRKPLPTAPKPAGTHDPLGGLGDREGWDAAPGGGWRHDELDITCRQLSPTAFTVEHAGDQRLLTSATGVLCVVDQIIARTAE